MSQTLAVLQSLAFAQPLVLWLIALAVPMVVLVPAVRLRGAPGLHKMGVFGLRLAMVSLFVGALAEPTLRPAGHARAIVFAVDVSDSVGPDQQLWARAWIARATRALPPGSYAETVEFGEHAQVTGLALPRGDTTNLSAALRLAAALLPRDPALAPEVVLFTDGWQTVADAATPAEALPSGIAVSFVPLPASAQRPVAVVRSLDVPPVARAGDRIDVVVGMQAAQAVDGRLRLWVDGNLVGDGPIHLETGATRLALPQHTGAPGFVEVRAELQVGDVRSALTAVVVA
jgi:hypothetical protein